MITFTATYSPDDNKIRLTASSRLDAETYKRVRDAGYIWAPKQKIFVAPMWTPGREDLAIELAGEVGDEDTTLADRAEDRAERFGEYSVKRLDEAQRVRSGIDELSEQFANGQPILVGHHSEKRARKDQERIQNGMRKSLRLWDTSEYWTRRAAGALQHAKYKALPGVRVRRIKKIEAEARREVRSMQRTELSLRLWSDERLTPQKAMALAYSQCVKIGDTGRTAYDLISSCLEVGDSLSASDAIDMMNKCRAQAVAAYGRGIEHSKRWLNHFDNRLAYERAMLAEAGYVEPVKRKRELLPICNYRAGSFQIENRYHRGTFDTYPQTELTTAEYMAVHPEMRGTRIIENSHRVRIFIKGHFHFVAFLTDSKIHPRPEAIAKGDTAPERLPVTRPAVEPSAVKKEFEALRKMEKAGVQVVVAPQLFATPPALADRMADALGDIMDDFSILEPSAGTGRLIQAVLNRNPRILVQAIEINPQLSHNLLTMFKQSTVFVWNCDFLSPEVPMVTYDRVIMNPPFINGSDIRHIRRAYDTLKPGGKLVALCANGPRQSADLKPWAESTGGSFEPLPDGSFAESGTNVNAAMVIAYK